VKCLVTGGVGQSSVRGRAAACTLEEIVDEILGWIEPT